MATAPATEEVSPQEMEEVRIFIMGASSVCISSAIMQHAAI